MTKLSGNKLFGRIIEAVKPRRESDETEQPPLEFTFRPSGRADPTAGDAGRSDHSYPDPAVEQHNMSFKPDVSLPLEPGFRTQPRPAGGPQPKLHKGQKTTTHTPPEFNLNFYATNANGFPDHSYLPPPAPMIAWPDQTIPSSRPHSPEDQVQRQQGITIMYEPRPTIDTTQKPPTAITVNETQLLSLASTVSDITLDNDLRNLTILSEHGILPSFRRPSLIRRASSSDLNNLQELQQLCEVFPRTDRVHATQLLKRHSIRTALIILGEESVENALDFQVDGSSKSISSRKLLPIVNEDIAQPEGAQVAGRLASEIPVSMERLPSGQSVDLPVPVPVVGAHDRKPSSVIRRSNSFTSMTEFEDEVEGIDIVMDVFPSADEGRSKYLLRQYSLSTVLMILASET